MQIKNIHSVYPSRQMNKKVLSFKRRDYGIALGYGAGMATGLASFCGSKISEERISPGTFSAVASIFTGLIGAEVGYQLEKFIKRIKKRKIG